MISEKSWDHSRRSSAGTISRYGPLTISLKKEILGAGSFSRSRSQRSDQEQFLRLPAFDRLAPSDAHSRLVLLCRILRPATLARISKPLRQILFHLPREGSQSPKAERSHGVRLRRLQSPAGKS